MELKHAVTDVDVSEGKLLIVPYGIETVVLMRLCPAPVRLLIVPYGIETPLFHRVVLMRLSFNRTLWN